ncbi:hypothetical protein Slin15195_G037900 [Septoria linicola]|uniref:Uncharacterized protein n=1 Tax=Septoria linicola TaxID=215465 RepID=A0A9Q9ATJ0_9PEZI|nr:hypothetical protein Slin15195_G037900 [Septoria linicola]
MELLLSSVNLMHYGSCMIPRNKAMQSCKRISANVSKLQRTKRKDLALALHNACSAHVQCHVTQQRRTNVFKSDLAELQNLHDSLQEQHNQEVEELTAKNEKLRSRHAQVKLKHQEDEEELREATAQLESEAVDSEHDIKILTARAKKS